MRLDSPGGRFSRSIMLTSSIQNKTCSARVIHGASELNEMLLGNWVPNMPWRKHAPDEVFRGDDQSGLRHV